VESLKIERKNWIDTAKGIAMIMVIVGHVSGGMTGVWDFNFVYGIHLVVFFLLSGYTCKKKTLTLEYINGKFSRLMVPYFYTCFFIVLMDVWNSWFWNHDGSIATATRNMGQDLVRSFFASGSNKQFGTVDVGSRIGAIWFLPALFFALILFQFLLNQTTDSLTLGLTTGAMALIGFISGRYIWLPFSVQSGFAAVFFLWIGYEIREREILSKLRWRDYLLAQVILLFGIRFKYCSIQFVTASINDLLLSIPVSLAGSLLVYGLACFAQRNKLLLWTGRNSGDVLCTHLFTINTLGRYVNWILDKAALQGNARVWARILIEIVFALALAAVVQYGQKLLGCVHEKWEQHCTTQKILRGGVQRDATIDVARGIFILLMLVGYFAIDQTLRTIIYSCHMVAFVFWSGYFYRKSTNVWKTTRHMAKTFLLPYLVFVLDKMALEWKQWSGAYVAQTVKTYALGSAYAGKLFSDSPSVGPVYFILLLFAVQMLYLLLDAVMKDEKVKLLAVILLSWGGMKLGTKGYWLPWSVDVALYALVFYQIGVYVHQYHLLERLKKAHAAYFVLASLWAYMIAQGGMEIAVRNYGSYGLVVLGATAGVLLFYQLAAHLTVALPMLADVLAFLGRSTIVILIVYTLLNGNIKALVAKRFDQGGVAYMVLCILIQLLLSCAIQYLLDIAKERRRKTEQ
jgi:fucose 4-O-acetylase-like acetyltransferase